MKKTLNIMNLLIGIAIASVLSGCQSTPKVIRDNGINRAENKIESALSVDSSTAESQTSTDTSATGTTSPVVSQTEALSEGTVSQTTQPESTTSSTAHTDMELNTVTKELVNSTPSHIKETIDKSGKTMIIDAQVVMPEKINNLHIYTGDYMSFSDSDFERLKKYLFGSYASDVTNQNGEWVGRINGEKAALRAFGNVLFGFTIVENTQGNTYLGKASDTHAPGCKTSLQDAVNTVENFLNSFQLPSCKITSQEVREQFAYNGDYSKMGTYRIEFIQTADNVPIASDYEGSSEFSTGGYFVIDDRGVRMASAKALKLQAKEELPRILTLEQAIQVVESKIGTIRISKYTPVFEISFEYFLTADYEVVPCWRFMVDQTEVLEKNLDQTKYWSNDFVVLAHSGEVFHVPDRYPAMMTEDGTITGGNPNQQE